MAPGCGASSNRAPHLTPGPAGAFAATPMGNDRIVVLAGSAQSRTLYVLDLRSDLVVRSFGVTGDASDVTAIDADSVLIGIGVNDRGRSVGALERWDLTGKRLQITPLPSAVVALTRAIDGVAYALVAHGTSRAAFPVTLSTLSLGTPLSLDSDVASLSQCKIGSRDYLLYTLGDPGVVVVRDVDSTMTATSVARVSKPTCVDGNPTIYGIARGFVSRSIVELRIPTLEQRAEIGASNDLSALYAAPDNHLVALNATTRLSSVEKFGDESLDAGAPSP
ncbi:MAG: hypothetical protein ABI202_04880 [Candidatus Baltobacteraceae bacterium]